MKLNPYEQEALSRHQGSYWWHEAKRNFVRAVLRRFGTERGPTPFHVLDVGAGTSENLRRLFPGSCGIMTEPSLTSEFRSDPHSYKVVCQAGRLPFRAGGFDLVMAADVLEHIHDDVAASQEIRSVMRASGAFLLTVPAGPALFSSHDLALGHFRRYTVRTVGDLVNGSGFNIRYSTFLYAALLPAVILRRMVSPPHLPKAKSSYVQVPGWINRLLVLWFAIEAKWLSWGRLPFGSSICVLATPKS